MALNYVSLLFTEQDAGNDPQAGSVIIAPTSVVTAAGVTVVDQVPVVRQFSGGTVTVSLVACDNTGTTPVAGFWAYSIQLPGGVSGLYLVNFSNGASQRFDNLTPVVAQTTYGPAASTGFANPMTTLGDIIYENATPAAARLAGSTSATKNFLTQTGTGSVSAAPAWGTIAVADLASAYAVTFTFGSSGAAPSSGTYSAGQVVTDQNGVVRVCTAGGTPGTWTRVGQFPWQFYADDYGARGSGKIVNDGAITTATNTLTCATSTPFAAGDVGKLITVEGAGTTIAGSGTPSALSTTIATFISSSQVTLTANAGTTVTAKTTCFGTDDTAAIQNAVNAAATYATANRYFAEVIFRPVTYMIGGALVQGGTSKGNSQITLPVVPITSNPTMVLKLTGTRCNTGPMMFQASGDTPMAAAEGTVLCSTLTGQVYSGTFGEPCVIGGPSAEQGFTGANTNLWNNLLLVVDGLTIMVQPVTSMTALSALSCVKAEIPWFRSMAAAPAFTLAGALYSPVWSGAQSFPNGLVMPQGGNNAHSVIGSYACEGFATGVQLFEHATFTEIETVLCGTGMVANGASAGHNITGLKFTAEANNTHLAAAAGNPIGLNIASMQVENISQYASGFHIDDSSGFLKGRIGINTSQTVASLSFNGAANLEIILDYASGTAGAQARGFVTPPAVPATTVALKNPFWKHATVYLTSGGAAVTAIAVNGTATGLTLSTSGTVMVRVPSGATITLTYASTAPTWTWDLD